MVHWTAKIDVPADADKIPDGPVEAAKYAMDQVRRLSSSFIDVERHNDDGSSDNWLVDTTNGNVIDIGKVRSSPEPEERLLSEPEQEEEIPILPGCLVERIDSDLDAREVVSVGRDWLTLDILGTESERLPLDNYRAVVPADGRL